MKFFGININSASKTRIKDMSIRGPWYHLAYSRRRRPDGRRGELCVRPGSRKIEYSEFKEEGGVMPSNAFTISELDGVLYINAESGCKKYSPKVLPETLFDEADMYALITKVFGYLNTYPEFAEIDGIQFGIDYGEDFNQSLLKQALAKTFGSENVSINSVYVGQGGFGYINSLVVGIEPEDINSKLLEFYKNHPEFQHYSWTATIHGGPSYFYDKRIQQFRQNYWNELLEVYPYAKAYYNKPYIA